MHSAGDGERESEMVKEDAMNHDMRPPPEIAAEVDRDTFDAKWQAEHKNARDDLITEYSQRPDLQVPDSGDFELTR
ncbi:MAG: hypothetical protein AAF580_02240 [Pseudomonadota bacterium]